MKFLYYITLIFSLVIFAGETEAQDKSSSFRELDKIRIDILKLTREYEGQDYEEKSILTNITKLDSEIFLYEKMLDTIERSERNISWELNKNRKDLKVLKNSLEKLKDKYRKRAVNYYKYGLKNTLELLLETGSVSKAASLKKYYQRLSERDQKLITDIHNQKINITKLNNKHIVELNNKKELLREKINESDLLKNKKALRNNYLNAVRKDKNRIQLAINEKKKAEKYLLAVINDISKSSKNNKNEDAIKSFPSFSKAKGRLIWPVAGMVISRMGITSNLEKKTKTENRGIEIQTLKNADVRSVEKGIVSMIKWLPWYGQTVFVEHSEGYYTVYGRVNDIAVTVNDIIDQNQLIGYTAIATGSNEYKLNFQIWKNSKNLDPEQWLDPKLKIISRRIGSYKKNR